MHTNVVLEARGGAKRFGHVHALLGADLALHEGEIGGINAQESTAKMAAILARDPDVAAVVATFGHSGDGAATAIRQHGSGGSTWSPTTRTRAWSRRCAVARSTR
jgi:hypothetical protein